MSVEINNSDRIYKKLFDNIFYDEILACVFAAFWIV